MSAQRPQPRVTVLMAVHNEERYVREAVDSILQQSFSDFELLIIDDASTDTTREILSNYTDSRIRMVLNEENLGLTRSLNRGLAVARGDLIARHDANDLSSPDRFSKQVSFLDRSAAVGLVGTAYTVIDSSGRTLTTVEVPAHDSAIKQRLKDNNQFCHGSVMFRRRCLDRVGSYRERFKYAQDYDLWLRISKTFDLANLAEPLYKWRLLVKSTSLSKYREQLAYAQMARSSNLNGSSAESSADKDGQASYRRQVKKQLVQEHLHWSCLLFEGGNYSDSFRVLGKSLYHAPLFKQNWYRLAKTLLILPRSWWERK